MSARRSKPFHLRLAVAGAITVALATAAPASGGAVSYIGSVQLAQGTYFFDQTLRGVSFMNGFSLNAGAFTLSASIPLIYQSSPYVSYSGIGVLPSGGAESDLVKGRQGKEPVVLPEPVEYRQYGVGDPLLYMGIRLWEEGKVVPSLQVVGQAKVPLATLESGFGTGEWDYGAGISLGKRLGGVFLFADLGYWVLGDLPDLELKNPWSYVVSMGLPLSGGKAALMLSYSGLTEIIAGVEPPSALGLGLSIRVGSRSSLLFNGSLGLSESSPDFSASFGWSIGL
jgi:hypothetical protein